VGSERFSEYMRLFLSQPSSLRRGRKERIAACAWVRGLLEMVGGDFAK
jgi:hypothetical protein